MSAVFTNLQTVLELSLKQMCFATVALYEDIFGLDDALFGRNCLYSLCLFIKPGHLDGLKVSTTRGISELRICCGSDPLEFLSSAFYACTNLNSLQAKRCRSNRHPQNSMPCWALIPALNGCLISVISVTRSAASISSAGASLPVTTMWSAGCEARAAFSSRRISSSGSHS